MANTIRRALTAACLSIMALVATGVQAQQGTYPNKPITFVVPYPAGGATDILARLMAQKFSEAWKVPVVVENKPGAGGTIGNQAVVKATPDGYTVLVAITALVQQIDLMKLPYDPLKDLAPLTRIATSTSILAVPTDTPANNAKELVELVKKNPNKFSYGTYGPGTSSHLQGAVFSTQNGLDLLHVPFKGAAPLMTAMLGNQVSMAFFDAGSSRSQLPKFKLLGVTGTQRLAWLPDVPTLKEQGQKMFEPQGWFGFLMPAGTPKPILDKFSTEAIRILAEPDVKKRIEDMGLIVGGDTPEQFAKLMRDDAAVYSKIIKDANIKIEQ